MQLQKLGIAGSLAIYVPAAILLYCVTHYLIPYLSAVTGREIILFWFIFGGMGVFMPLIIVGLIILKSEGFKINKNTLTHRLRFRKLTWRDLTWTFAGLILVGILSTLAIKLLELFVEHFDHSPPFMAFEPLSEGRYWLLFVWAPYWVLNILGEEFLWRGVMLPRQELAFGRHTWVFHGFGWGLFHIAFGWQLLITLIPLIFIQSYIVQRTKNSWTGVIMHGGLNGPAFIAISFGWI